MKLNYSVKLFILNMIIFWCCFISTVYVYFNVNHDGYTLLFTQPIIFYFMFILILNKKLLYLNNNLFYIVFIGVAFIRYVLLPSFIVYSSYYGGRSSLPPSNESFTLAIILMNIELIIISIMISFFSYKNSNKYKKNTINYEDTKNTGYYIFILLSIILVILFPKALTQINFIIPSSLNYNLVLNTIDNLILYCIIVSKQLFYILLMKKIKYRYEKKNSELWIILCIFISIASISIYSGTNRMDIVISAMVSIYVLIKLYGKKISKYFVIFIPLIIILFNIVTDNRDYISISNNKSQIIDFTDTLQAYTGGIYNVAIAIETVDFYPEVRNIKVLLMDIFRPMIGPNILVKNINVPYSNIFFNRRIRPNSDIVSQIIPMVGQSYIFFGALLSPVLSVIFIRIQYYLERILNTTDSLELFYFISLSTARIGMLMGNNTMNLINDLSMNLALFSLVYFFNKYITLSDKSKLRNESDIFYKRDHS